MELAGLQAANGAFREREAELSDELQRMEYRAGVAAHNATVQAAMAASVAAAAAEERRAAQVPPHPLIPIPHPALYAFLRLRLPASWRPAGSNDSATGIWYAAISLTWWRRGVGCV